MKRRQRNPFSDFRDFDKLYLSEEPRAATRALTPELEAVRLHAKALVDHERGDEHDSDLCAKCLLAQRDDARADARNLDRSRSAMIEQERLLTNALRDAFGDEARPESDADAVRLLANREGAAARRGNLNALEHTFVGRVAQQPCVHGRKREDGPCPAYERTPATHAADPVADPLDCPPCAARRLMADMEPAGHGAAPTASPGRISDAELRRLALGLGGDSPAMIIRNDSDVPAGFVRRFG